MPVFLRLYGFRFFSISFDLLIEPFHLHVQKERSTGKYWIFSDGSVELAQNNGFKRSELNTIEKILLENGTFVLAEYKSYCHANNLTPNYKTKRKA